MDDDVPAAVKRKRRDRLMAQQKRIVRGRPEAAGRRSACGWSWTAVSDEHELVLRGRLAGQAPEIDPLVYLTECDPSLVPAGHVHRRRNRGRPGLRPARPSVAVTLTVC